MFSLFFFSILYFIFFLYFFPVSFFGIFSYFFFYSFSCIFLINYGSCSVWYIGYMIVSCTSTLRCNQLLGQFLTWHCSEVGDIVVRSFFFFKGGSLRCVWCRVPLWCVGRGSGVVCQWYTLTSYQRYN